MILGINEVLSKLVKEEGVSIGEFKESILGVGSKPTGFMNFDYQQAILENERNRRREKFINSLFKKGDEDIFRKGLETINECFGSKENDKMKYTIEEIMQAIKFLHTNGKLSTVTPFMTIHDEFGKITNDSCRQIANCLLKNNPDYIKTIIEHADKIKAEERDGSIGESKPSIVDVATGLPMEHLSAIVKKLFNNPKDSVLNALMYHITDRGMSTIIVDKWKKEEGFLVQTKEGLVGYTKEDVKLMGRRIRILFALNDVSAIGFDGIELNDVGDITVASADRMAKDILLGGGNIKSFTDAVEEAKSYQKFTTNKLAETISVKLNEVLSKYISDNLSSTDNIAYEKFTRLNDIVRLFQNGSNIDYQLVATNLITSKSSDIISDFIPNFNHKFKCVVKNPNMKQETDSAQKESDDKLRNELCVAIKRSGAAILVHFEQSVSYNNDGSLPGNVISSLIECAINNKLDRKILDDYKKLDSAFNSGKFERLANAIEFVGIDTFVLTTNAKDIICGIKSVSDKARFIAKYLILYYNEESNIIDLEKRIDAIKKELVKAIKKLICDCKIDIYVTNFMEAINNVTEALVDEILDENKCEANILKHFLQFRSIHPGTIIFRTKTFVVCKTINEKVSKHGIAETIDLLIGEASN